MSKATICGNELISNRLNMKRNGIFFVFTALMLFISNPAKALEGINLLPDPGFESGLSDFVAQSSTDSLVWTTVNPIAGNASMEVTLNSWGSNVWWTQTVSGTDLQTATSFTVQASVRAVVANANSPFMICADAMYADSSTVTESCTQASSVVGQVDVVSATIAIDPTLTLGQLAVRLTLQGNPSVTYYVDTASAIAQSNPAPSPSPSISPSPSPTPTPTASPSVTPSPIPTLTGHPINLSAVWANEGGDKVVQSDLRVKASSSTVLSNVWNGSGISLKAAKNEVVNFNMILESAFGASSNVQVKFNTLTSASGATIQTTSTNVSELYNWVNRPIELFYVRYLPIHGLSLLAYETYDERHIPYWLRRPWTGQGLGTGLWTDRPDHDKYYPDIAVPMELVPTFNIAQGNSQAIWADIYVPTNTATGIYTGTVQVYEGTHLSYSVPVQLQVYGFALPDTPTTKTMVYAGDVGDWSSRYLGETWPERSC